MYPTPILMYHYGRSGSTVIADLFSRTGSYFWPGEIFTNGVEINDTFKNSRWHAARQDASFVFTLSDALDYIEFVYTSAFTSTGSDTPPRFFGFEIKPHLFAYGRFPFSLDQLITGLASRYGQCKPVFLARHNVLRRLLSGMIANKSGVWHVNKTASEASQIELRTDAASDPELNFRGHLAEVILRTRGQIDLDTNVVRRNGGLILSYEEHVLPDPLIAYGMISDYVGSPREAPHIRYGRTNPFDLGQVIANYSEVEHHLRQHGLADLLT